MSDPFWLNHCYQFNQIWFLNQQEFLNKKIIISAKISKNVNSFSLRNFMIFNPLFIVMENRLMMKRAVFFARYFEYNKRKRREEYKRHVAGYIYILMQSWKKEKDCSYQFHLCNNIYKWIQIQIITYPSYDWSFLFSSLPNSCIL